MREKSGTTLERPLKFSLQTDLQYRIHGEKQWHDGKTVNVSVSEIVFEVSDDLTIGAVIDIQYVLPIASHPSIHSTVHCQGEVIRNAEAVITAKVAHCRLSRG